MDLFITLGFWLAFIVLGAFDVIGLVEGGKSIVAAIKGKTKIWVATIASFLLSYVVAYFIGVLPAAPLFGSLLTTVLFGGTTIFAFVEIIGYNMIVKTGFALFDSATAWARKKISGADGATMTGTGSTSSGQ